MKSIIIQLEYCNGYKNQNKMYISNFYCQPDHYDKDLIKLESLLNKIMDISKNNEKPNNHQRKGF